MAVALTANGVGAGRMRMWTRRRQDSTSTDGSTMMSGSGWTASASAGGDSVPGTTFKDVQIALGLRSALDGAAAAPTGRHSAGAGGGGGSGSSPSTSTADTRAVAPAPTWASERQRQQRRHARSREKSEKGEKGRTRIAELGRALSGRLRRLSAHGNNAASSSQQPKSRPTSAAARCAAVSRTGVHHAAGCNLITTCSAPSQSQAGVGAQRAESGQHHWERGGPQLEQLLPQAAGSHVKCMCRTSATPRFVR